MVFSFTYFTLLLPLVWVVYWIVLANNSKRQNFLLLVASYYFYSCWDWRFSFLIFFSTLLDFYTGLKIQSSLNKVRKKAWLTFTVVLNLGILLFFKYYNFFAESILSTLNLSNQYPEFLLTHIVLPIGISFYTFHGLSYVFDIYNDRIIATEKLTDYSLFVVFFPLLLAGPIERATHLLPQIKSERKFNLTNIIDGMRQIIWGLFKKLVIADNLAPYVNIIFASAETQSSFNLIAGALLFSFQIYSDFSGYSDIAAGIAKLFGFEIIQNFSTPYFAYSFTDFWKRWHVSLSSWFRDYVYLPLGGNKISEKRTIYNLLIVFVLSGLWHGANWTFVIWGFMNAIPIIFERTFFPKSRNLFNFKSEALSKLLGTITVFTVITASWIFFRSESIDKSLTYYKRIFLNTGNNTNDIIIPLKILIMIASLLFVDWYGRKFSYTLKPILQQKHLFVRWGIYIVLIFAIIAFAKKGEKFIYIQF